MLSIRHPSLSEHVATMLHHTTVDITTSLSGYHTMPANKQVHIMWMASCHMHHHMWMASWAIWHPVHLESTSAFAAFQNAVAACDDAPIRANARARPHCRTAVLQPAHGALNALKDLRGQACRQEL